MGTNAYVEPLNKAVAARARGENLIFTAITGTRS
jgi:hypothetical protein